MLRFLLLSALLVLTATAHAQQSGHGHAVGTIHQAPAAMSPSDGPREPGQAAFAAIQEIVSILTSDPATDWSKVDIDALRRHLIDMDNVTLRTQVETAPIANGLRFTVSGEGAVRESIRRMVKAHAETMRGTNGMLFEAADAPNGAVIMVKVADAAELRKLKALGFLGVMTLGMHHQEHHLKIATRYSPHH